MPITIRGVLLIGAVALIALKLAGALTWPWWVILIPALGYLAPFILGLASIVAYVMLGLIAVTGVVIATAFCSALDYVEVRRRRERRMAEIKAGALQGPWDYAA